jgi:hypothetical protein
MTTGVHLDPDRDLDLALTTAAEMNRMIAGADAKAGLVLAAQGVALAGIASALRAGPPLPAVVELVAVGVIVLAGISVILLVACVWPRTHGSGAAWFAFPALGLGAVSAPRPGAAELAEQAWAQAGVLAEIARRKYRWFRAALLSGAVGLAAFTTWIALLASV